MPSSRVITYITLWVRCLATVHLAMKIIHSVYYIHFKNYDDDDDDDNNNTIYKYVYDT